MRRDVVVGVIFAAAFSFMVGALLFTERRSSISAIWFPAANDSAVPGAYKPQLPRLPQTTIVLGTVAHAGEFFYLRSLIGSVHYWEFGREIIVFAEGLTESELIETSLASFTRVVDSNSMEAVKLRRQKNLFLVPVKAIQDRRLCAADRALRANRTVALLMSSDDRCQADECFGFEQYFTYRDDPRGASHETCSFDLRYPNVTAAPLTSSRPDLPFWCVCIATYAKSGVTVQDQALLSVALPSLNRTVTAADRQRYNFALYIGSQVDHAWAMQGAAILARSAEILGTDFQIRHHSYPINSPLIDITWKYNRLLQQAYADGCSYLYQYSDDAEFITESWATRFAESLERSAGFGTVGARDTNNAQTMTLGASARLHIYIQHYFWPETLKNWYSDNYIQWVYGKYSVWMQDILIRNSQKFGQRYAHCEMHSRRNVQAQTRARYRALEWARVWRPEMTSYLEQILQQSFNDIKRGRPYSNELPDRDGCPSSNDYSSLGTVGLPPYSLL